MNSNPHNVQVGDKYQSNDRREDNRFSDGRFAYQPPPFKVIGIDLDGGYCLTQGLNGGTTRKIRLDRMKPTGKSGYTKLP